VDEQISRLERGRIEEALRAEGGNISRTAARLGLPRNTLRYRMERHGLLDADASSGRRKPEAPSQAAPVQWQRTRVTMLQAQLEDDLAGPGHEHSLALEEFATKIGGFGGRIIELGASFVRFAFGLDIVEDAARHAAHAAFAVQRAASAVRSRPPVTVRIALHTEEMPVGRLDDRVELDADARRTTQGVLDRLLAMTSPEPIVVSAATKPFLERGFDLEPVAHDVLCWRVRGLLDGDRHASPFVSRTREIALLEDLLSQVEDGRGQAVLLAGDPGIGKTRLLQELHRRTRGRAAWYQGSAVSFGSSLPLHPLIDLLKDVFSIRVSDADEVIGERIDQTTAAFGEPLRGSIGFLQSLLSIEPGDPSLAQLDPKLRRAGIFEAIGQLLHALAGVRPVIVVLEDVHWMDQATGEFLALMVESLGSSRILLCLTHRTGYTPPFAPAAIGTQLTLSPVAPIDSAAMGCSILGAQSLSADLQQFIDRKTEGNPFFVEEVLRSLQERGLIVRRGEEASLLQPMGKVDVPDTIRDVLHGRMGRLDRASRDLLRVAAVIGREFPRRVLERVVDDAALEDRLRALRSADLIQNARVWPEVVYAFKHAVTQEVAYAAESEDQRRAEHARIGVATEQVYADRLSEHVGVLAHHFTQAQRWPKALEYLLAAAQQAEHNYATREALALYDEARRAAEQMSGGVGDPATLMRIHEAKARLYFVTSEFQSSVAEGERILPLARLTGNRAREAEALAIIAWASTWGRDLDGAIRFSKEAIAVGEAAGALAVQGRAHFTIGFVRGVTGVLDESRAALDRAVEISNAAGDAFTRSLSLSGAGLLRNWAGDYGEAERLQSEGRRVALESRQLFPLLFSCFQLGLTYTGKGDYDQALASMNEGLSFAERVGDEAIHHRLLNCFGWLYADLGDLEHAEELNATSARIGRSRKDPGTQPNAELNLAEIFAARGEIERAQDQYDGVFRYWADPGSTLWMRFRYSVRMFYGLGQLALARGDLTTARSHCAECLGLATRSGSRKNLVKAWRLAGQIAQAERAWDTAEGHLRTSLDLAVALGNPVQRWKAEIALGQFLQDVRRPDEARDAFVRALAVMEHVREGLRADRLRAALEKNPDLRLLQGFLAHT
jgi:tetratricopeptide (TPR) repeat protein